MCYLSKKLYFFSFSRQKSIISSAISSTAGYTIGRIEVVILTVFSIIVPTADNCSDLRLSLLFLNGWYTPSAKTFFNHTSQQVEDIVAIPQYKYSLFTFLPVLVSFLFTIRHWWKTEDSSRKRWTSLPLLVFQVWPQSRVCRILHFFRKGNPKWIEEKEYFESELSTIGKELFIDYVRKNG